MQIFLITIAQITSSGESDENRHATGAFQHSPSLYRRETQNQTKVLPLPF